MKLYKKLVQRNYNSIADQLKKCGGICDNRLPQGFSAIAMFDYQDIYVNDELYLQLNSDIRLEIDNCLTRFSKDDYGIISDEDKDENVDNKYFGNGKNIIGKYETSIGVILIELLDHYTLISM